MRFILHCGYYKCGSSAIQVALAQNFQSLVSNQVYYPRWAGFSKAQQGLVTSGNGHLLAKFLQRGAEANEVPNSLLSDLSQMIDKHSGSDIIFSSELFNFFNPERGARLKDIAERHGYEFLVVSYFRSISGHAKSRYSQDVRDRSISDSFETFIRHKYQPGYKLALDNYIEAFGADSLNIRNYDRVSNSLLEDFFGSVLGISIEIAASEQRINRPLSLHEIEFTRQLNKFDIEDSIKVKFGRALAALPMPADAQKLSVNRAETEVLEEKFQEDVIAVNALIRNGDIACVRESDSCQMSNHVQLSQDDILKLAEISMTYSQ